MLIIMALIAGEGKSPRSFAVQISQDELSADEIAARYGLINKGQVGGLTGFYWFEQMSKQRPMVRESVSITLQLSSDQHLLMVEEQVDVLRGKRSEYSPPTDPNWPEQWTLYNGGQLGDEAKGHDLNVEPAWIQGLTGRGITVAIVDDGILYTNQDLTKNFDPSLSVDLVEGDNDVHPDTDPSTGKVEGHGTACAGVVAMEKDNNVCGVGVAYESRIAGVRLLSSGPHTDLMEGAALSHAMQEVDIYSNSWGPYDDGVLVEGPGQLATRALHDGVTRNRGGLGSIYVWASGNGGHRHDSCSTDGYVSSIYTIAVGSVDQHGQRAFYDEECPSKLIVAINYNKREESASSFRSHVTTTGAYPNSCRSKFLGTSAACALVSGTIALALQANPSLTWRDVQHLLIVTASHSYVGTSDQWMVNGGGHHVSRWYGFGVVDTERLVSHARTWVNVPEQTSCKLVVDASSNWTATTDLPLTVTFKPHSSCAVNFLEHVVIETSLEMSGYSRLYSYTDYVRESTSQWGDVDALLEHNDVRRGDLSISLTSPQGTTSQLLPKRRNDIVNVVGFNKWPFMSVLHWGETPMGEWILNFTYDPQRHNTGLVTVTNITMMFYGTSTLHAQEVPKPCDVASNQIRNATDLQCVLHCPPEFKVYRGYCIDPNHRYVYHSVTSEPTESTMTSAPKVTVEPTEGYVNSDPAVSNVTFEPVLGSVALSGVSRYVSRVDIFVLLTMSCCILHCL